MDCIIKLKIGDETISFTSDKDLDAYLYAHQDLLIEELGIEDVDATLHASSTQHNPDGLIDVFGKRIREHVNSRRTHASPSVMWGMLGHARSFDSVSEYGKWLKEKGYSSTDAPRQDLYDVYKSEKSIYQECGTEVHAILENAFRRHSKSFVRKHVINDEIVIGKERIPLATAFMNALKTDIRFRNKVWQAVPEVDIISDELDSERSKELTDLEIKITSAIVNSNLPDSEKQKSQRRLTEIQKRAIAKVKGKIDLVVFDEDGYIHLFDYKTYSREFNDPKINDALFQLVTYKHILEQAGFKVKTVNIVPIQLNIGQDGIATIEKFEILQYDDYSLSSISTVVNKYIPLPESKNNGEVLGKAGQLAGQMYPDTGIESIKTRNTSEVKYYMNARGFFKTVLEGDTGWDRKKGTAIKYFWDKIEKKKVYIYKEETDEEVEKKVAKYVESVNNARETEITTFANMIEKCIKNRSLDYLRITLEQANEDTAVINNLIYSFRKYIVGGWKLYKDPILADNGILLFEKDQRYEIVVLDVVGLNKIHKMTYKDTVLGNRRVPTDIQDSSVTLDSRWGHLLLMKTMLVVNENPDLIRGRIQEIKAINIHEAEEVSTSLSILQDNYNRLKATYLDLDIPNLKKYIFMNDANAYIHKAYDWLRAFQAGVNTENLELSKMTRETVKQYSREEILKLIRDFARKVNISRFTELGLNSWELPVYNELLQAYLSTYGINLFTETGLGKWFTGALPNGTELTPFAASTSGILKSLDAVNANFDLAVETRFNQEMKKWQMMIKKLLAKPQNEGKSNNEYFSTWFAKSGDVIAPEFVIKHLSAFTDPDEKAAAEYMLDLFAKYRGWDQYTIDKKKAVPGSEYYQIPLLKATMLESWQNGGSVITSIKDWFSKLGEIDWEKELGLELSETQKKELNDINVEQLKNFMLDPDQKHRVEKLSEGISNYSRDLDKIFAITLSHSIRSELSRDYLPIFTGFRVWLETANTINQTNSDEIANITDAVTKWIKANVFGRSLIDSHEVFILKLTSLIKQLTSGTTLVFSMTGAAREMLTSSMMNYMSSKDWSDPDIKNFETIAQAYCDTIAELSTTTDILSKDQQLNSLFAAAGIDVYTLGENNRTNKWKLNNASGDWLYVMQQAPDYFHRLSYLKAKLMARGSFDAYSLNEDGVLTYDFNKDKYYEIYRMYAEDPSKIPSKDVLKKFEHQKEMYLAAIESWKRISGYEHLKPGMSLPQALSPDEIHGVHVNCNLMHGFYNSNSKVLLQKTLYGGLLFQFKTVPLARMVKLFHPAEAINVKTSFPVVDPETRQEVWIDAENNMKREDDLSEEDIKTGRFKPYRVRQGNPMVGHFISTVEAIKAAYAVGLQGDQEAWKKYIEDPWNKRSLYIALWDLLGMAILQFLVGLAHPNASQNIRTAHWLERFSYTVLNGAVTDVGVFNVVNSVIGDGAPPSFAIIQNWVDNTMSVIYGDMNPIYAMLNTFGATKPLSNIVYAW